MYSDLQDFEFVVDATLFGKAEDDEMMIESSMLNMTIPSDTWSSSSSSSSSSSDVGLLTPRELYYDDTIDPILIESDEMGVNFETAALFGDVCDHDYSSSHLPVESGTISPVESGAISESTPISPVKDDSYTTTKKVNRTAAAVKKASAASRKKNMTDKRKENAQAQARCRQRKQAALDSANEACAVAEARAEMLENILLKCFGKSKYDALISEYSS